MKIPPLQPNKPQPTFGNKIYQFTKSTLYGKRIHGMSRGYDLDVYVKENNISKEVEHKLYCVFKDSKWIKSYLRFFKNDKVCKEIRSVNKNGI